MKKLWLKQIILTLGLMLGFAAVASAQTTGDPRCAGSAGGPYWVTTRYVGLCVSSQAEQKSAQHREAVDAQAQLAAEQGAQQTVSSDKKLDKHPTIRVQVVDTEASTRQHSYVIPAMLARLRKRGFLSERRSRYAVSLVR